MAEYNFANSILDAYFKAQQLGQQKEQIDKENSYREATLALQRDNMRADNAYREKQLAQTADLTQRGFTHAENLQKSNQDFQRSLEADRRNDEAINPEEWNFFSKRGIVNGKYTPGMKESTALKIWEANQNFKYQSAMLHKQEQGLRMQAYSMGLDPITMKPQTSTLDFTDLMKGGQNKTFNVSDFERKINSAKMDAPAVGTIPVTGPAGTAIALTNMMLFPEMYGDIPKEDRVNNVVSKYSEQMFAPIKTKVNSLMKMASANNLSEKDYGRINNMVVELNAELLGTPGTIDPKTGGMVGGTSTPYVDFQAYTELNGLDKQGVVKNTLYDLSTKLRQMNAQFRRVPNK